MKSTLTTLFWILTTYLMTGQVKYLPGYFITNDGTKTNCLIRNVNWRYNPIKFDYKLTENSDTKSISINEVEEFVIDNESKYIRRSVDIDRSSEVVGLITSYREPRYKNETLFLKLIIEGEANLYSYYDDNLQRFFYSYNNSSIAQLIYKPYLHTNSYIRKNNDFRDQLLNDLKCEHFNFVEMQKVDYTLKDLTEVFQKYNECRGSAYKMFIEDTDETKIKFNIKPGINLSKLTFESTEVGKYYTDFGNKVSFRFGVEAEISLKFNSSKWSLTIEPTYEYYKSSTTSIARLVSVNYPPRESEINYSNLLIPVGVRHYFFLNDNNKIFLDAQYNLGYTISSEINIGSKEYSPRFRSFLSAGAGFKYKDYSIALRYALRELGDIPESDFDSFSIIMGYTLF